MSRVGRALGGLGYHLRLLSLNSRRIVSRPMVRGIPDVRLVSVPAADGEHRIPVARRLLGAYRRAVEDQPRAKLQAPVEDMWTFLVKRELGDLLEILEAGDAEKLADFLLHFGGRFTWFGGLTLSIDGFNRRRDKTSVALSYLDKLVCLAEALGVLSVENPEQHGQWGWNIHTNVDRLVLELEQAIGIAIAPPSGAIHTFGIESIRGPIHYRHMNSLYAALRIRDLMQQGGAICEYGGGLGIVAYYANMLGLRDYTIFDLPIINVFAGNFLMNTLGTDAVRLYGDDPMPDRVNVLPYWACVDAPDKNFELSLNQDSFPEIESSLVIEYLHQIERTTKRGFLSINQEAGAPMGSKPQNLVSQLVRENSSMRRAYRMKYWIREGYVEEFYEIVR